MGRKTKISYNASENHTMYNPSFIDDYGFTPEEFRVFSRIMRRCTGDTSKGFYESIPKLAKELKISERLVRRSLKVLTACNAITRTERPGQSDLFDFNTCDRWKMKDKLTWIRSSIDTESKEKDMARKQPVVVAETTGVGNDTGCGNARGTGSGNDRGVVAETQGKGISPEGYPKEGKESACVSETGPEDESKIFISRHPFRQLGGERPLPEVPQAFGPYRDALEDWWCQAKNLVTIGFNADIADQITWLYQNKFTLADIQAFYQHITTDPEERAWRKGTITLGTIAKGIADWKLNSKAQAAPVAVNFDYCDQCDTNGFKQVLVDNEFRMVKCKHEGARRAA
jgi:hypothetical protein